MVILAAKLEGDAHKRALVHLRRELLQLAEQRREFKRKGQAENLARANSQAKLAYGAYLKFKRSGRYEDAVRCARIRG
jgi:hypothetical protein